MPIYGPSTALPLYVSTGYTEFIRCYDQWQLTVNRSDVTHIAEHWTPHEDNGKLCQGEDSGAFRRFATANNLKYSQCVAVLQHVLVSLIAFQGHVRIGLSFTSVGRSSSSRVNCGPITHIACAHSPASAGTRESILCLRVCSPSSRSHLLGSCRGHFYGSMCCSCVKRSRILSVGRGLFPSEVRLPARGFAVMPVVCLSPAM